MDFRIRLEMPFTLALKEYFLVHSFSSSGSVVLVVNTGSYIYGTVAFHFS